MGDTPSSTFGYVYLKKKYYIISV